jgi:asparagine synthase (glutamine-hydrolysing)
MFSFVLLDESLDPPRVIAARDPIGITTLYQGWSSRLPGAVFFASELKCLVNDCDKIISFPPGHVYDSRDGSLTRYYKPLWWNGDSDSPDSPIPSQPADLKLIRETLEAAVKKRLMCEVPYGVLLSGGLDSSIIAAIAARETERLARTQFDANQRRLDKADTGLTSPPGGMYFGAIKDGKCSPLSSCPIHLRKNPFPFPFALPVQILSLLGPSCTLIL